MDSIDLGILNRMDSTDYVNLYFKQASSDSLLPEFDGNSFFYFFEQSETKEYFLSSIIQDDDNCCVYLYYVTFNKRLNKIIDAKCVAMRGHDGHWGETARGKKYADGRLVVTEISQEQTDYEMHSDLPATGGYRVTKDSIVRQFQILKNGQIVQSVIDSTQTIIDFDTD